MNEANRLEEAARLHLLPHSPEGIRRLSIVLAAGVAVFLFISWCKRDTDYYSKIHQRCVALAADAEMHCADLSCAAEMNKEAIKCFENPTKAQTATTWTLYLIGALFWGYIVALGSRLVARISIWVYSGFALKG